MAHRFVQEIQGAFSTHANPEKALPMKSYLKEQFEFYGIQSKKRRELQRPLMKKDQLPPLAEVPEVVKAFWQQPQRELQYCAMELMEKFVHHLDTKHIPLLEYCITTKSWWDTVDMIATHLVSTLFKERPELIKPYTAKWLDSGNMWLQRSVILFQLKYKRDTDTALLFKSIDLLKESKEFFIQKAIGWALREYAKTDPSAVVEFVNNRSLAPLSTREALRHINPRPHL